MAECNGCGRTIDDKYEYCPHCGTRRGDFLLMKYNSLSQKEDKRKKTVRAILAAGIVIVILAGLVLTVSSVSKKEYLTLPESGAASKAVIPDNCYGKIEYNSDESAYITIYKFNENDFDSYISTLMNSGFNIDSEYYGSSYSAYNSEGYRINAYCYNNELNIDFSAPIKFVSLSWPSNGLGALIPVPDSNKLSLLNNSNEYLSCHVGDMDYAAFSSYCNSCVEAGFNLNYVLSDNYFYGDNSDFISLNISYEGFNTILINMYRNENTGN